MSAFHVQLTEEHRQHRGTLAASCSGALRVVTEHGIGKPRQPLTVQRGRHGGGRAVAPP